MSDQRYVTKEEFEVAMLRVMRLFLIARRDAQIAESVSRLIGVPEEDRLAASHAIQEEFEELMRRIEQEPVLDALELLRRFEGPTQ